MAAGLLRGGNGASQAGHAGPYAPLQAFLELGHLEYLNLELAALVELPPGAYLGRLEVRSRGAPELAGWLAG